MRCLWLEDGALSVREEIPVPEQRVGEALVEVLLSGVCATDLELKKGYYPFAGIPGHEFVGRVVEGSPRWKGRRVVGEINCPCGNCRTCLAGRPTHCPTRTVLGIVNHDGAFAQYLLLPEKNLHGVPDTVSNEEAVFCEPLAAALEILDQAHIKPSNRVALFGAGRLGQLVARVVAQSGCDLVVVDPSPEPRALLEAHRIRATPDEPDQGWADVVIDATGNKAGFDAARRALRPRGTLVLKSTYAGSREVDLSSLVVDEITIMGSRCGPFAPALAFLERKLLTPQALISSRFSLAGAVSAFEAASQKGALKVLIDPAA